MAKVDFHCVSRLGKGDIGAVIFMVYFICRIGKIMREMPFRLPAHLFSFGFRKVWLNDIDDRHRIFYTLAGQKIATGNIIFMNPVQGKSPG